ncbi:phage head-tail joining protein [Pseudomonas schmalbachii]|uniref:phage head-tail joining protein n=1 Tax=Pseudomonas schmalbachii TaxID=2816993 RepID=UPI001F253D56|nr:hypothetical protein [Pseudomonas schmalbachii]
MAYTIEQYHALEAAIADGALTVHYSGAGQNKSVTYRSLDEMIRILNLMAGQLGMGLSTPQRTYASFTKGQTTAGAGGQCSFCGCCGGYHIAGRGCGCHG